MIGFLFFAAIIIGLFIFLGFNSQDKINKRIETLERDIAVLKGEQGIQGCCENCNRLFDDNQIKLDIKYIDALNKNLCNQCSYDMAISIINNNQLVNRKAVE